MYLSENLKLKNAEKMRRWRVAKDAKRKATHKHEPIRQEVHGLHVYTVNVKDELTGKCVEMELRVSDNRTNSWRVDIDGKVWREQIGMNTLLRELAQKMPPVRVLY